MYDIIIIGGGISGLNCALQLSESHKVLLLDNRDYWGGRIITNKDPQYEIGAARFNTGHRRLRKLISQYDLGIYKLPKNFDFLHSDSLHIEPNVNLLLDSFFKKIITISRNFTKKDLQNITFKTFCNRHVSKNLTNRIINRFGYTSEFEILNAYDAIRTFKGDFNGKKQYFIIKRGMSELCNSMIKDIITRGGKIKLNTQIKSLEKHKDYFRVYGRDCKFLGKKIIFAIKPNKLKEFSYVSPILKELDMVQSVPLIRIYAKYTVTSSGPWFKGLRRLTTDSFLRNIIPINESKGLIMVSYADGTDVNSYYKSGKLLKTNKLKTKIHNELKRLFPEKKIPHPTYFKSHLWTEGVHLWRRGSDSKKIFKILLNPMENIYICGEGFSLNQCWVEGALDTSDKVVKLLKAH